MCSLCSGLQAQNWMQIGDFPGGSRDDGVVFTIGDSSYCGTGRNAGFTVTSDFFVFDHATELWSPISAMPDSANRQYATAVTHNGKGYVFGGINDQNEFLNDLWSYNPSTNQWDLLGTAPFDGRSGAQSFVIDDKIFVVGGRTSSVAATNEVWSYDLISGIWDQKNDIPGEGIWRGFATAYNNTGVVGMGADSTLTKRGEIYYYTPSGDTWMEMPQLSTTPMNFVAANRINDRVYVFGGEDAQSLYSNEFRYLDLTNQSWNSMNAFTNVPRRGVMSFVANGNFYFTTGLSTTQRLDETWVARNVVGMEEETQDDFVIYKIANFLIIVGSSFEECFLLSSEGKTFRLELNSQDNPEAFLLPDYLPPGVYFCYAVNGEQRLCEKIMIH